MNDYCLENVFLNLTIRDIQNARQTCKRWRDIVESKSFWFAYKKKHYNEMQPVKMRVLDTFQNAPINLARSFTAPVNVLATKLSKDGEILAFWTAAYTLHIWTILGEELQRVELKGLRWLRANFNHGNDKLAIVFSTICRRFDEKCTRVVTFSGDNFKMIRYVDHRESTSINDVDWATNDYLWTVEPRGLGTLLLAIRESSVLHLPMLTDYVTVSEIPHNYTVRILQIYKMMAFQPNLLAITLVSSAHVYEIRNKEIFKIHSINTECYLTCPQFLNFTNYTAFPLVEIQVPNCLASISLSTSLKDCAELKRFLLFKYFPNKDPFTFLIPNRSARDSPTKTTEKSIEKFLKGVQRGYDSVRSGFEHEVFQYTDENTLYFYFKKNVIHNFNPIKSSVLVSILDGIIDIYTVKGGVIK